MKNRPTIIVALLLSLVALSCTSTTEANPTPDDGDDDTPSRREVVASGTIGESDRRWELHAELLGADLCLELRGTVCVGVPTDDVALQGMASTAGTEEAGDYSCSYGAVSPQVDRVTVLYDDASQADAEIFDGESWGVNFFVRCIDQNLPTSDVLLADEAGNPLTFLDQP